MIELICIRGDADKEASEIQDALITSEWIARQRGTNFINENWYITRSRTIRVPYKDGVAVGDKVSVYESLLNLYGNHLITSHSVTITKEGIWADISIQQHEENS